VLLAVGVHLGLGVPLVPAPPVAVVPLVLVVIVALRRRPRGAAERGQAGVEAAKVAGAGAAFWGGWILG
jgi:hypothetical protein